MFKWPALRSWEHGRVEQLAHHLDLALRRFLAPWILKVFTHENDAATWTAKTLMGCCCHNVSILYRIVEQSGGNETCRVSHVDHEQGSHLVGNVAHACIVPLARVGRSSSNDELRLVLFCQTFHFVIVNASRLLVQRVGHGVIENAASVDMATVAEVSSH